ncbi:MAG: ribulose-phosphate 3-epimerase [Candidatus Woesearchaeota archaeon]
MRSTIIASIIATSQKGMDERIDSVKNHVSAIQLDVMDSRFVPTHSLDFDLKIKKIKPKIEAHLMINNPGKWIDKYSKFVDAVIFHYESVYRNKINEMIKKVRIKKKKVGIAISPKTSIQGIIPYLDEIDQVIVMTVVPGWYGAKFVPHSIEKIKELRRIAPRLDIEVDGGINPKTIKKAKSAGANRFVVGSYLQKSRDIKKSINTLKSLIKNR